MNEFEKILEREAKEEEDLILGAIKACRQPGMDEDALLRAVMRLQRGWANPSQVVELIRRGDGTK